MKSTPITPIALLIIITMLLVGRAASANKGSESRVDALLKSMTLDEKIGQMTQVDYLAIKDHTEDISKFFLGSIFWGGGSEPPNTLPQTWADIYDSYQKLSQTTRLKIPILFGIDAVHGHNNVDGAVIFPHNIGLGATRNPDLVSRVAMVTAQEIRGTGIQWDFAPCVAVVRNERWGRTYESFGEDPELVRQLSVAYVVGMQKNGLSGPAVTLACVKHYFGDGGTTNGVDQGNTECDEATLRKIHLPGYIDAIKAGARSIMASYSSWNGVKMHGNKYLLTDVLKKELGFGGFVVSDWAGIDQLAKEYKKCIEMSINAGMDMVMIPNGPGANNNYIEFITKLKELISENKVPLSRIDDAVRRILTVKDEMNLQAALTVDRQLLAQVGSKEHREVARDAVRQSIVVLKNDKHFLPLSKNVKRLLVAGRGADNIGMQCGGWTISWQGAMGKTLSGGTTILTAVNNAVSPDTKVIYSLDGSAQEVADAAVVVIGEEPYAEMVGDRENLKLSTADSALVQKVQAMGIPFVVVLFSGRPIIIDQALSSATAFVAAWLPGTEGQGVTDVLFGDFVPVGKLSHSWPKSMKQVAINIGDSNYEPLFPYGFGLTYMK